MSIDVSVVVPVYNAEPYLKECVDSLINQTLKNVEFIFVDDGSTDRSYEILAEYQRQDDRIQILRQQNLYAGVARNNGMKIATGKYIIFLDSDDFFELDMLEKAFNCAEENQAEITYFDYYYLDLRTNSSWIPRYRDVSDGVFSPDQAGDQLFRLDNTAPWNKLYLRSFIDDCNVEFQPIKKNNDTMFTCIVAMLADRIIHLKKPFVHYRMNNPTSLQGNYDNKRDNFIICLKALKQEMTLRGLYVDPYKQAYRVFVCRSISDNADRFSEEEFEGLKQFYLSVKESLIPSLFETQDDFINDQYINSIYEYDDIERLLFMKMYEEKQKRNDLLQQNKILRENNKTLRQQVNDLCTKIEFIYDNTASKKSKDYRIGHAVLTVPRMIQKAISGGERAKE